MLSKHPKKQIKSLVATKYLGKNISFFDKRITKKLPKISSIKTLDFRMLDLIFLSLPNGEAQKIIKKILINIKRLNLLIYLPILESQTLHVYFKKFIKIEHKAKHLIRHSLYSISEFNRKEN